MAESKGKPPDKWQRWESLAKIIAGFSAAVSAILIPILINSYTEQTRKAEMYIKTMTEREKSDTEIRQSMFHDLLTGYLGAVKDDFTKGDVESFRRRIMFLELLAINFQEYFNAKPLFEEVHAGLERRRTDPKSTEAEKENWEKLEREIVRVARNIVSRQAAMLNTLGDTVVFNIEKEDPICVRLYSREDFAKLRRRDGVTPFQNYQPGYCVERSSLGQTGGNTNADPDIGMRDKSGSNRRQSLEITLAETEKSRAVVRLGIYEDIFDGNTLRGSVLKRSAQFEVSAFDMPYMDNTKLSDGSRFSLVLKRVVGDSVEIEAIRFKNDFISLRDRPLFEEMLRKLRSSDK